MSRKQNQQETKIEKNRKFTAKKMQKQKYLIIFDDILGMANMANNHISKEARFLNSFISTYRHGAGICQEGRISCMWFIQYYKSLLPTLRVNASYVSFLGKHSEKNIKQTRRKLFLHVQKRVCKNGI